MLISWLDYEWIMLETFFFVFFKISDVFSFKAKHYIGRNSETVGPIDMKPNGGTSIWC